MDATFCLTSNFLKFYFPNILCKRIPGKIPHYTSPPVRKVSKPSESEWKKEFDVEKALKNESPAILASLRPLIQTDHIQVPSITPLAIDFDSMVHSFNYIET